jgi:hypothetical protein
MLTSLSRRRFLSGAAAAATLAQIPSARSSDDPPKPRLKIGQIGVGHAHATKLEVYRGSPDYEVVGIVEPDSELRQRAQSQAAFRDLPLLTEKELLGTPGLAAVLVVTRVRDLLHTAERCIAAG